jgi:hypothetical protein
VSNVRNFPEHRYKHGKVETALSNEEFERYLQGALKVRSKVNVPALLSMLNYSGLRVSEITGDVPHKYHTKDGEEHLTKVFHGLRKKDLSIDGELLKINCEEVRKHGKREEPLFIPLNRLGVNYIIDEWKRVDEEDARVFPCSKWLAWYLISHVTEGRLYPHYFRLNLATKFASDERTSLIDLMSWFGWSDARTASSYMSKAGRTTRKMADRL